MRGAHPFFLAWQSTYSQSIAVCYARPACDLDVVQTYADGSTYILSQEVSRLATLFRDGGAQFEDGQSVCREERSSIFGLFMGMAVEIDLIKSLKPGEAPPKGWAQSSTAPWEDCTSRSAVDYQALSEELRTAVLPSLRRALVAVKNDIRAGDWANARESSTSLAALAADVGRRATRDYPPSGKPVWMAIENLAWDADRVSADIAIPRVAATDRTAKLIDSVIHDLDDVVGLDSLW